MKTKLLIYCAIGSFLLFGLFNCSEEESTPTPEDSYMHYEGMSGEIGILGGTIEVNDPESVLFGTTVEVPEGALSQIENITISVTTSPNIFTSSENQIAIQLEPAGLTFNEPLTVTMPYSSNIDESDLKIFYYDSADSSVMQMDIDEISTNENLVSFTTDHFSTYFTTGNNINICSGEAPNETNVLNALADFSFDGSTFATYEEAVNILKHLCSLVSVYPSDEHSVTARFPSGYYITIWVGTYGKTDRYGVRYGTDEDLSFWGSNVTYFEIIKPYDINFDGTWLATEYIDTHGRDMLNGFSFVQQQTLCDETCVFDFTWYAKYESFQVTFNGDNVTMNYYITMDYPSYECSPCEAFLPDGVWDTSDQDIRYATCSYDDALMTLNGFILAYGGEMFYPTIVEYSENYLYLKEGTAELKLQRID